MWPSWKKAAGLKRRRELTWSCSWLRSKRTWRRASPEESWGRLSRLSLHLRCSFFYNKNMRSSCLRLFWQTHYHVFSRRPPKKRHKISTARLCRWTVPRSCVEDPRPFTLLQERSCRRLRCCLRSSRSLSVSSSPRQASAVLSSKMFLPFLKVILCCDPTEPLMSNIFWVIGSFCCTDVKNL